MVYGVCVSIANIVMCFRFNNHQGWGEILCFGSILVYYTLLFVQGFLKMFPQTYYIFDDTFRQPVVWYSTLLTVLVVCALEVLHHRARVLGLTGQVDHIQATEEPESKKLMTTEMGMVNNEGSGGKQKNNENGASEWDQ